MPVPYGAGVADSRAAWSAYLAAIRERAGDADRRAVMAGVVAALGRSIGWTPPDQLALAQWTPTPAVADLGVPAALARPDLLGRVLEAMTDPVARRTEGAHYTPGPIAAALLEAAASAGTSWDRPAWGGPGWGGPGWGGPGWDGAAGAPGIGRGSSDRPALAPVCDPACGGEARPGSSDGSALAPVCDPACGGGAFLLAAADRLAAGGADPGDIVRDQVWGIDLDPVAVAVADASLACWAWLASDRSGAHPGDHLAVADALLDAQPWPEAPPGGFGLVIGNPPFQGQLGRATARPGATTAALRDRFGAAVGAYTDTAALFLVAAGRLARPGGRIALILPSSVLASRDAARARAAALVDADLVGLWVAAEPVFAASVRVCAPVLVQRSRPGPPGSSVRHDAGAPAPLVDRWRGRGFEALPAAAPPGDAHGWAAMAMAAHGVPEVSVHGVGRVGDLATASAGFRDQFYGLVPYVREAPGDGGPDDLDPDLAALVTTGLVDLADCAWGRRPCRFAGRSWRRPAVDLAALRSGDQALARWVDERLMPKALVASQTKVGEVVLDRAGRWVASVPLVTLVAPPERLPELAAVIASPVIAALALARTAGTALGDGAIKLSARQVLDLPLPCDAAAWAEGTAALASGDLDAFAPAMTAAYAVARDDPVIAWWRARLPPSR
ncbi:MAG: hypothetical protein JWN46_3947 [Acidimicrobiales bacterium]|nr:hypothetical protein [Acidimicrobiales bacterium]